jgi:hypothetical protein
MTCAGGEVATLNDIVYAKRNQITSAQLAVNGEIEQCEISALMIQLQSNTDSRVSFGFSGGFWPSNLRPYSMALRALRFSGPYP